MKKNRKVVTELPYSKDETKMSIEIKNAVI